VDLALRLSPLDPLHYAMLGTRTLTSADFLRSLPIRDAGLRMRVSAALAQLGF